MAISIGNEVFEIARARERERERAENSTDPCHVNKKNIKTGSL